MTDTVIVFFKIKHTPFTMPHDARQKFANRLNTLLYGYILGSYLFGQFMYRVNVFTVIVVRVIYRTKIIHITRRFLDWRMHVTPSYDVSEGARIDHQILSGDIIHTGCHAEIYALAISLLFPGSGSFEMIIFCFFFVYDSQSQTPRETLKSNLHPSSII